MDEEMTFSLSYEQLTRIAEEHIRECELDSQGARYISESGKARAVLSLWFELAIGGATEQLRTSQSAHLRRSAAPQKTHLARDG